MEVLLLDLLFYRRISL